MTQNDWAEDHGRRWLAHADRLEAMLAPVDAVLLPAAELEPGMSVLDVGCGRGATARAAAAEVGAAGDVTGVDISADMIAQAAARTPPEGSAPVAWVVADAATHAFPPARYHRVISRFGVLFFDDPVAAFANLRGAVRPDGGLVVATWQPRDASEFQSLAVDTAVRVAAEHGHRLELDPPDAGPFAYGSAPFVTDLVRRGGWADVELTPVVLPLYLGGPGTTPAEAVEMGRAVGPLGQLLAQAPPTLVDAVTQALTDDLTSRWDGTGCPLQAAITIVTARAART